VTATASDTGFVAHAPAFEQVTGEDPRLSRLAEVDAHEGPVYFPDENALYFTSLPKPGTDGAPLVQVKRMALEDPSEISVLVAEANGANGMTADREGRLIVCEQGSRREAARVSRIDRTTGEREPIVEAWRGLLLNSPNDVVQASDGTIWFTDPSYGHLQGFRPKPEVGDFVYRHDPATGDTTVVADGFDKPNGIAFSPDERTLYVTDSGANQKPGTTTSTARTTSKRSTSVLAGTWKTSGCSRLSLPASPTGSRSTAPAASTPPRSPAFRYSTSTASYSAKLSFPAS
jgi:gluconolactonase